MNLWNNNEEDFSKDGRFFSVERNWMFFLMQSVFLWSSYPIFSINKNGRVNWGLFFFNLTECILIRSCICFLINRFRDNIWIMCLCMRHLIVYHIWTLFVICVLITYVSQFYLSSVVEIILSRYWLGAENALTFALLIYKT